MALPRFDDLVDDDQPSVSALPAFDSLQDETEAAPEVSMLESLGRGGAQGLSFGFADEITGALESMLTDKSYEQARDESRKNYMEAEEANPKTFMAGNVAGAVAPAIAMPATLGVNSLKGMAALGAVDALGRSEADLTKGDMSGALKDTARGAAMGAAAGGVAKGIGSAAENLLPALRKLASEGGETALGLNVQSIKKMGVDKAEDVAEFALKGNPALAGDSVITPGSNTRAMWEKAAKVKDAAGSDIGSILGRLDDLGAKTEIPGGAFTAEGVVAERQAGKMDRYLLTNPRVRNDAYGIGTEFEVVEPAGDLITVYRAVPKGESIIKPGEYVTLSPKYAQEHLDLHMKGVVNENPALRQGGNIISMQLPKSDLAVMAGNELVWAPAILPSSVPPSRGIPMDIAQEIYNQIAAARQSIQELAPRMGETVTSQYTKAIDDFLDLATAPNSQLTFKKLGEFKKAIGDVAYKHGSPIESKAALQDAYAAINEGLTKAVERVDPQMAEAYKAAKKAYDMSLRAIDGLEGKAAREAGGKWVGFGDVIVGGIGSSIGGVPGAVAAIGLKRAAEARGAQTIGKTSFTMAEKLEKALTENPQILGKFLPMLQQAAQRGQLAATNYVLQQRDPEYAETLKKLDEERPNE